MFRTNDRRTGGQGEGRAPVGPGVTRVNGGAGERLHSVGHFSASRAGSDKVMLEMMSRYWWALVLRGLAAIMFGVLALVWPGLTLGVLVLLFGSYALIDGLFTVVAAIGGRRHSEHWFLLLLEGLLGVAIGVLTWVAPGVTATALLLYIAVWSMVTGVLELSAAIRLRKEIRGEVWLGLAGALSIGFGMLLLTFPIAGALSVVWLIGAYSIAFGIALTALGIRVHSIDRYSPPSAAMPA